MKIICIILLFLFFLSCKKQKAMDEMILMKNEMNFIPNKSIKIRNLLPFKNNYVSIGSYTIKKDSILSQFEIESKYSLIVIKLKNVSNSCTFNNYSIPDYPTPGYFSTINEGLYEVNMSPQVFEDNYKINKIDFISDHKIEYQVNTDTIKSFSQNFSKYAIKINNENTKVIYSKIEYYGLKNLDANFLFYKIEGEMYIFIMTPMKEGIILDKNILYDYLFG